MTRSRARGAVPAERRGQLDEGPRLLRPDPHVDVGILVLADADALPPWCPASRMEHLPGMTARAGLGLGLLSSSSGARGITRSPSRVALQDEPAVSR